MSEDEKINIIRVIREELQSHREYADVKYATKESLNTAKETRDLSCSKHQEAIALEFKDITSTLVKIDKQFIYVMGGLALVGVVAGVDNLIPMISKFISNMIGLV